MRRILALGAHYDDVEIGVGGTLLKHVNTGDKVFIAITDSDEFRTGDVNIRHREQLDSLNMLGIDKQHLLLFKTNDDMSDVIGVLDKLKFDVVYTMFELDTHQAHRRCSYIGQSVGRDLPVQVVLYNSGTSYDFFPNVFSIIFFDFKQKLLSCFKSQIEVAAINIDIIQRRESYWTSLITEEPIHAEGFIVRKMMYSI
jgi:LmbE family N-acetylglucosaminyl deacetylase